MPKLAIKDTTVKSIITAVVEILLLALLVIFLGGYLSKRNERLKIELAENNEELTKAHTLIKNVPDPQKAIEDLRKSMDELQERSVSKRELPKIIQELITKSSELEIEIISIRPREDIKIKDKNLPQGVSKAYIEMIIKCSYDVLGEYLNALSELSIIFTIENMHIEKIEEIQEVSRTKKEAKNELYTNLLLSTYTLVKY